MPAVRRLVKKTVYAALFGLIIAIPVIVAVVPNILRFRTPEAMPAPEPESIAVESIDTVRHADKVDIVARIRNPNPRAGVPEYIVTFVLLNDQGQEMSRLRETTYLLPGSVNYIAALSVPLASSLSEVRVETPNQPQFVAVPESNSLPTFNSFLRGRSRRMISSTQGVETQKGVITNTSTLSFGRVDITGVAFDAAGNVVGIGKTFVGEFMVGEQREFTLEWPSPLVPTQRVIILPATNIFREDNILNAQGDPSLLR
jgi:hypothetical protein